jgi:hypothetical protein
VSLAVEQLVVDRLREWLLLKLPAKVTEVNAARAAVLVAPNAGPYTIPVGGSLRYSASSIDISDAASMTDAALTSGSRTAAQVASDFNTAVGASIASADGTGRFVLTAAVTPSDGTDSVIALGEDSTGAMAALGFPAGGAYVVRQALIAPDTNAVMDGAPLIPEPSAGFWVILGDNASVPLQPAVRRDENVVAIALTLGVPVPQNSKFRQEHLRAALRCVREVLFLEPNGRTLGNAANVVLVEEKQALLKARPIQYAEFPNQLFCRCGIELQVRVFERQAD